MRLFHSKLSLFIVISFSTIFSQDTSSVSIKALELFKSIDNYFRFSDQYSSHCSITLHDGKGAVKTQLYKMFVKDSKTNLLYTLAPEKDKGKMFLMRGNDVWCYFPKAGKSILVSYNKALMGTVTISDIVNPELTEWYELTKSTDSLAEGKIPATVLSLKRKNNKAAFPFLKIYFAGNKIVQAESFASTQIPMRKTIYSDFLPGKDGTLYAATVRIENSLRKDEYSIIKINELKEEKNIPAYYFSPDNLQRVIIAKP
jgi:outer membrane lipoprotein-sorting protein